MSALLAAVVAVVSALLSYWGTRRKTAGEQSLSERDAFNREQASYRAELRDDFNRLNERVESLEQRNEALEIETRRLRAIMRGMEEEIEGYRFTMQQHNVPLPPRRDHWRTMVEAPPAPQPAPWPGSAPKPPATGEHAP